jgi:polyisoprenyl-phosphate glycosyltransferase
MGAVDLSLAMPCYNEEEALPTTTPELARVFADAGVHLQLVLVDNGSTDGTGAVIDSLVDQGLPITKVSAPVNLGYGGGILAGLRACEAPLMGYSCADGQVSAADTLMVYHLLAGREDRVLAKVRRRFRQDSWRRKLVSISYNGVMQALYGGLGAIDINGSPKLFSRAVFERMDLVSEDWFLDPEIIIKARYLGLKIIEIDVEGHARRGGTSHVDLQTCTEFAHNIGRYRLGGALSRWRRGARGEAPLAATNSGAEPAPLASPLDGVRMVDQQRHEDERGFVHKVLRDSQARSGRSRGEVYVTSARPGESKGHHLHRTMGEWFAVVEGRGELWLADPAGGLPLRIEVRASRPSSVYVPAGVAHALVNRGKRKLVAVAWADGEHDPDDVHPFAIEEPPTP